MALPPFFSRLLAMVGFVALSAVAVAAPQPEEGLPLLRIYTRTEYRAQSDFWSGFAHARNGRVYFGNHLGLLEFDGRFWRALVSTLGYCRAIAEGPAGEIFAADDDALGFFPTPDTGEPQWTSLTEKVPATVRPLGRIRNIVRWRGAMWFAAESAVLRWNGEKIDVWPAAAPGAARLFAVGDRLLLQRVGEGLAEFTGRAFQPLARDPLVARGEIIHVAPRGKDLLLVSAGDGLLRLSAQGALTPWLAELPEDVRGAAFTAAITLRDGALACATQAGVLAIFAADGGLLALHTRESGLPHADILSLTEDPAGQLWIGTTNGPTKLDWRARATCFDSRSGLGSTRIRAIARHDGTFYLLNGDGLQRLVPGAPGRPAHFEVDPRGATIDRPTLLLSHAEGLLVVARNGLHLLGADGARQLAAPEGGAVTVVAATHDPARLFIGTAHGILTGRLRGGVWQAEGPLEGFDAELADLVYDADGTLWASTISKGVYRLRAHEGQWLRPDIRQFTAQDGLPANHGAIYAWHSSLGAHFDTAQGMYRYDATHERMEFDRALVAFDARKLVLNPLAAGGGGEIWTNGILTTRDIPYPLARLRARRDGGFDLQRAPVSVHGFFAPGGAYRIFAEPETGIVWAAGERGLLRVETAAYETARALPAPQFTAFTAEGATKIVPLDGTPRKAPLLLNFSREQLTVAYASRTFADPALERFQVRLLGFNPEWSAPTEKTETVYTNLEGGPFTFQVRTVAPDGTVSPPVELTLVVLPPWERTRLAYALYAVALVAGIAAFIRWRLAASRREQARLERIVQQRTRELAAARDEAEAASRAKSTFLAHMSHELRTPLNGIIGYAQVLLKDAAIAGRQRERVNIVHASGLHLLRMINEVLDFSKIEAGKIERHDAPFHFGQLLRELAVAHEAAAHARGLTFALETPSDLPSHVSGDAQKLRQILDNLLSNAVKFTPQGRVTLRVERLESCRAGSPDPAAARAAVGTAGSGDPALHAPSWRFTVVDTGVGLGPEDRARLFQPFEQARSGRPAEPGTGLGLAITLRLVQLLGGELQLESEPGRGSQFSFVLALPAVATPETAARPAQPLTGYAGPRRRILVVDDNAVNRSLLSDLLTPLGFVVAEYASAEEMLAAGPGELRGDLAFLDVKLPGIDGLELARRLRTRGDSRAMPIVFTSASVLTFDRAAAEAIGCPDFLPKPFAEPQLNELLLRLLKLEWQHGAAPVRESPSAAALPRALLEQLLALADSGDIAALRAALAEARRTHAHDVTLGQVETAAASYQLEQVRSLLRTALA
ncbi:MAG: response regulator [Candidatus Didemnitutus sp.]|nr:response regulator [Candidatus Didemnitutus sp.]